MGVRLTRLLSDEEHSAMNEDAISWGFYRDDRRVFLPGWGWPLPWYWDPTGEREKAGKHVMITRDRRGQLGFLSEHYWRDWADKRPPLMVVCPNGEFWEIDRKSSNGSGWTVSGEWPFLIVTPSIVVEGYHGFLGSNGAQPGEFTGDIEGRGPTGIARPIG